MECFLAFGLIDSLLGVDPVNVADQYTDDMLFAEEPLRLGG